VQYILLGGGATLVGTQILKSKYIPIQFEKYPRTTAAVVSLIAAVVTIYQAHIAINLNSMANLAAAFVGILLVAISTYNHLNLSTTTKG
jgi:hypothetical protein